MSKELRDKFSHIGFLDYKKVIKELDKIDSIREKLNYLKDIKVKYFDQFEEVFKSLNEDEEKLYIQNRTEIWNSVFDQVKTVTTLKIQEPVFNKYFEKSLNNPEFTYWFLEYNANQLFEEFKESEDFKKNYYSNLKKQYLKRELKKIKKEEKQANKLFSKEDVNIHENYRRGKGYLWAMNNENNYLIEVLRVIGGNYYQDYAKYTNNPYNALEVEAFYKHKLLKPYLEELIEEMELQQIKTNITETKKTKHEIILDKLKEYKFNELDMVKEIDLNSLSSHIFSHDLPYQIAYLDYLGFIKKFQDNYCKSQREVHKILAQILDTNERLIRGNINGLHNETSLDRKRYTAYQHIKSVEKHYQTLK